MDITGKWTYNENFDFGESVGLAELVQNGEVVSGVLYYIETVEGDYEIEVEEHVKGSITEKRLVLNSISVCAKEKGVEVEYNPNVFDIHLSSETKIVGSTYDKEGVCGVLVMEKK